MLMERKVLIRCKALNQTDYRSYDIEVTDHELETHQRRHCC
jgi:hypothetical protein